MKVDVLHGSGRPEGLIDEVRRLRKENTKLRKVVEAAKLCVEKDEEGAFTLILYDYDPPCLDRLSALDEALQKLET